MGNFNAGSLNFGRNLAMAGLYLSKTCCTISSGDDPFSCSCVLFSFGQSHHCDVPACPPMSRGTLWLGFRIQSPALRDITMLAKQSTANDRVYERKRAMITLERRPPLTGAAAELGGRGVALLSDGDRRGCNVADRRGAGCNVAETSLRRSLCCQMSFADQFRLASWL